MGRVKSKFSWAKAIILFLSFLLIASTLGVSLSLFRDNTTDEQSNNFAPIVLSDDSFNTLKSQVTVDMLGKSILVQPVSFVVSKDTSSSIYVRACVKFDGVANDARQKLAYESLTAATPVAGKSYKWTRFGQYYYLCDGSNQLVSLSSTNSGEVFNLLEKETNIVPEDIIDEKFAGGEKISLSVTLQSVQTSKVSSSNIERAHSSFNAVEPTLANTKTQCSIYFYDANGLSLGSQTVAYGKGVNIPTPASQSGKQHIGWNTKSDYTGATLDEEDLSSVYEDLVLYAEFDALTYNVTVIQPTDESGNQIGTITPGSTTMRYGQSLTFRVIPNANYYIYGVYIENDETHQKKNIGSLTEFVVNGYTSDITIWADISQEVIFLDINGGTGTQPRITFNEDKTKFVLSEIEPVGPNGKEFYYYSTNPLDNEEGQNGIRIDLGVEYPLSYLEGNKVLYAIYLTPTENYQTATNYIVVPKNVTSIEGNGEKNMFGVDTPDVKFVTLSRNVKKIGNSAFKNLDGLTGLSMSTVVDSIGNNAFENCVSLEQFVFGPFVNKIGDGAFKNCVSLSTLKNLENIPTTEFVGTFEGCTMLINVTLPSVATKIEGTFKNCSNLIEVVLPNGLRNIGESTFENCVSISVIEIPSTISFLGEKAFRNCVALNEIAGLENIVAVEIPNYIFENCVSLKEINIPSNTAIIGRRAFGSCSALEKIINLSIVKVGEVCEEAFLNCSSLGELIFNGSLNIVGSQAFAGSGVSKVSLSQRLSSLGESAFENCVNLSTVQNLGIISVIAQNTFKNCSNLFSITIPATVTTIETLAFENCSSLSSLNVPASVQTIGVDALKNATGLKSITLQGDLTTIYNLASTKQNWYYNTMMVEALNTKGYYTTFVSDWIVTNINGNNYITGYRGEDVNVTIPYIITDERGEQTYIYGVALNTYDKISGFENVVLEEGIQSIFILEGKNITTEEQLSYPCFKDCKTLKSISLPSTLSQISDGAFAGCENLTQIIGLENTKITKMGELFPARHTSIWEYDEIVQINNQDIKIAYDYKEILGEGGKNYRGTFESTALKEIKLPATLQIIGPLCFSNILTISTIHIPASVRAIGAGAFINLPALQSITGLENCVLDYKATVDGKVFECGFAAARYHVGDGASYQNFPIFWGLSIKTLTLPSFATFFASDFSGISVGSLIAGCLSLEEITLLGDWPQEFSLATINESEFGINSYQWYLDGRKMTTAREAGTYTIFPSSETSDWVVDENGMIIAYKGSNTTVTVPASVVQNGEVVTVVGVKSFRNPILTNITVSEGITKIDAGAFANMTKLKRVKLAKSILEIGNKAFENCSSLVSVVLPENTKTVGSDIFIGCSSIKIIVLNNDITTEQNLTNISDGDWFYQNGSSSVSTSLMKSKGIYSKYSNVATTAEWEVKSYQTKNYITAYLGTSRDITVPAVVVESDYSEAYEIYGLAALKKYNFTSIIISEGIETIGLNITDVEQLQQTLVSLGLMNTDTGIMEFPFMRMGDGSDLKFNDSLTTFVLPDSLDVVGIYGFAGVKLKGLNTLIELKNISVLGLAAFGLAEVDEIQVNMQATKTLLRIEQQAFVESTAKIISIGYGPTLIGEGAFNSCANLIELNLPTSVVTIEDGAFNGCSSLVELNLRDARQIGSISGCSSLEKIILGASLYSPYAVSNISGKNGSTWFYEGGSDTAVSYFDLAGTYLAEKPDLSTVWTYEQINGKWYITGYTGNSVNLTVPSSLVINGTETQIAGIKSINTNEGVDIETLVISEGIAEILENALSGKTKLSSITLPQTLTSIGANAFSGTIISLLTLGSENLTLNAGALDGMSELTIINVQNAINTEYTLPTNATWTYISYDSDNNQSSSSSTTTLLNKGIYTTLANVATTNEWIVGNENNSYFIAGYKLDYTDSTKILEIPRLVINHKTFEVYEISSIKSLYMQSLSNYSVEISLKVSEGITKIDTKSYSYSFNDVTGEYFSINQSLKGNGNNIVSIELPATLLELGDYAFANLNHLKEIKNLENTQIKELKQNAFYNNYDLTQLVFPITLQEIYSGNFSSCSALKKIILNSTLASSFDLLNVGNGIWYYNSETTRTITMQKAGIYSSSPIQNIGLWVVELIGEKNYITAYLGGATELVVPYELFNEDTGEIVQIFGVRGIGKTDLESITFEEGIEEIGEVGASTNIFGGDCNTLSKITLASTVTRVYDKALDNNETTNIIITILGTLKGQDENYVGYKLSSIQNTAWYYGVKNVENMKQVGSYTTFRVEAYMPKEDVLGAMGSASSFEERDRIATEANYPSADYAWYLIADWESGGNNWYIYSYLGSKSELDIPHYVMDYFTVDGCGILRELDTFLTLYKQIESTKVIQQDITKITLEEGYKTFGIDDGETTPSSGGAMATVKTVVLPSTLTNLGAGAFAGFVSLENINLDNTKITEIPSSAFYGAINLKQIRLPSNVTKIDTLAFYAAGLIELELNEGLISIGSGALSGLSYLKVLTIPSTLSSIQNNAMSPEAVGGTDYLTSLEKIIIKKDLSIPLSVESITKSVFYKNGSQIALSTISEAGTYLSYICGTTDDWNYETIDGKNYITGYVGKKVVVDVPTYIWDRATGGTIEIYGVKSLNNSKIRKLTIREGIKAVGNGTNNIINGTYNNTLTYASFPFSLETNDANILNDCNALETMYFYCDPKTQLEISSIKQATWHSHNLWLKTKFWPNSSILDDDVVTEISLAGGYSTYSIGKNIVQVKTAQGGFGGDLWMGETGTNVDAFVPAFGIFKPTIGSDILPKGYEHLLQKVVPMESVLSLRGYLGTSADSSGLMTAQYENSLTFNSMVFAEGITRIGDKGNKNNGFGAMNSLFALGPIVNMVYRVGSEDKINLLSFDGSFESGVPSGINANGGTLSLSNSAYAGSKALSYTKSGASKATITSQLEKGVYVFEAMVKSSVASAPLQVQLTSGSSFQTYNSEICSAGNGYQYVFVKFEVQSTAEANLNLVQSAIYDCMSLYRVDRGLPTTLTVLGANAFSIVDLKGNPPGLSSINLSQTAIEEIEMFALAYTFANYGVEPIEGNDGETRIAYEIYQTYYDRNKGGNFVENGDGTGTLKLNGNTIKYQYVGQDSIDIFENSTFVLDVENNSLISKSSQKALNYFDQDKNILSINSSRYYMNQNNTNEGDDKYSFLENVFDPATKTLYHYDTSGNVQKYPEVICSSFSNQSSITITFGNNSYTLQYTSSSLKALIGTRYYYKYYYSGWVDGQKALMWDSTSDLILGYGDVVGSWELGNQKWTVTGAYETISQWSFDESRGICDNFRYISPYGKYFSYSEKLEKFNTISTPKFGSKTIFTFDKAANLLIENKGDSAGNVYIATRKNDNIILSKDSEQVAILTRMVNKLFVQYTTINSLNQISDSNGNYTPMLWNFNVETNILTYNDQEIQMVESSEDMFWGSGYTFNAKTNRLTTPTGSIINNKYYFDSHYGSQLKKETLVALPRTLITIGHMALNTGATRYVGLEKSSLKSLEVSAFGGDIMVPLSQEIIDSTPYGKNLIELNLPASFEEITKTSSSDIALGPIIMFGMAGIGEDGQNLTYPTNFEGYAFVLNSGLHNINIAQGNTTFSSKDGVLFNANQTKLIAFPNGRNGNYSIPETVTTVGEASFMASQLSKVIFPANLTTIEDYAFCGTTVPASVVAGGDYEPMQESILKEFVGLEDTKVETIGRGAFACLTRLNTLLLPKTLKTMGASGDAALSPIAKAGLGVIVLNSSLNNAVTLVYNMEDSDDIWLYNLSAKVGEMQPKGVYSKGQFELSWKVEKIDEKWWIVGYLGTSSNLIVPNTVVNDDGEIVQVHGIKSLNYQDATQITVSDGIKEIGYPTDSNNILGSTSNSKLNAIVLMGDVQNMTENSLLGMKELSYITLSNDLPTANSFAPTGKTTWYHYSNGTSEIVSAYQKAGIYTAGELQKENQEWVVDSEGYIIAYKGSKTELVVPSHLLKENSDEVIIVKGIKSFKNNTYGSATTLAAVTSVTISNGIKTIEDSTDGAFRYLSNVVEINIPSTMTYIGHNAFLPCTALETLTIPNGVETIQVSALPMDKSLSTIILEGNLKNNFIIPASYGTWFYNSEQTPIDELSIAGTYKKATYSIKYDGKGATLSSGETSYIKSNFLQGKSITLDENQFTNQSNANFLGWTTKPRSVHVEYPAGGQFILDNATHVPTSDYTITLYAVWEQNVKILTLDPNWNNSADDQRGYTATKFGQSTNISQQIDLDFTTEIVISGSFATIANTNSSILTHLQSDSSNIKLAIIQNKLEVQVNNAKILSTNTLATNSGYSYFIHKTGSTIRLKVLAADGTTFFDNSQAISQLSGTTLTFGIGYANNDNGIIYGSTMLFESAMLKLAYLPDATNANSMLKINEDGSKTVSALNEATSVATTTLAVYKMIPTALRSTLPPEVLPSRFGYQIDGFYYNHAGSSASIYYTIGNSSILEGIDAYPYDADVVAEAYWIAKPITIKWNANGGTGSANNMTVYFDQGFKTRGVNDGISRVGYTLTGWRAEGWRDFDAQITEYQFDYIKKDWSRSATSYEINFYAIWTPNQYTVTFNPNGGSVSPTTKTVTYDSAYGALPTPTRTGYTFVGWKLNGTVITSSTIVQTASNHTLHAEWTANKYNIKFQANDATLVEKLWNYAGSTGYTSSNTGSYDKYSHNGSRTAELNEANYITFDGPLSFYTPIPIRIGHKFVGWYSAQTGGVKVADANGSLVANANGFTGANKEWKHADVATLYARWEAETYSITYSLNGGTNGSNAPTIYQFGNTKQISDPTKTGYTFAGWEVVATLDGKRYGTIDYDTGVLKYVSGYSKAVYFPLFYQTANVAYTGKGSDQNGEIRWRQFNTSGTYRGNNGNTSSTNCYVSLWYHGGMNAANTTIKWSQGAGYTIPTTQVGALSLTAKWTPNTYHVTYHPNGGSGTSYTVDIVYDTDFVLLSNSDSHLNFTKKGHDFDCWHGSNGSGWSGWEGKPWKWTYDTDVILYAQWTPKTYHVTYNSNGGTGNDYEFDIVYGETFVLLDPTDSKLNYSRDDHVFSYWSMNQDGSETDWKGWIGREWSWGYDHDVTFYAQWNRNYHIIYHANGGSGATMSETIVASGQHCVISQNTYTKTGYTFSHWAELYPDGTYRDNGWTNWSGTWQWANGDYSISDYKLNFYAQWTPNQYTVTFNPNGGSVSPTTATVTYDSTYGSLPTPTRTGYNFAGWWTATSNGTQITSSTKVAITAAQTLYAKWNINSYTLSIDPNGGYRVSDNSTAVITVTKNYQASENISERRKTGYTLTGYTLKNTASGSTTDIGGATFTFNNSTKIGVFTQGTVACTLVAQWTANTYAATFENMYWSLSKDQYNNGGTWSSDSSTGEDIYQSVSSTNNGGPYISNIATYMENNLRYRITFTAKVSANPLTLNASFEAGSSISISLTTSYQTFNLDTSYNAAATYKALTFYTTGWTGQKLYIKDVKLSKLVTYDSTYGTLPTPTRTGYTFAGWSKNMFNPKLTYGYSSCTRNGETFTFDTGSQNSSSLAFQIQTQNTSGTLSGILSTSSTGITYVVFTKDSTINKLRLKYNGNIADACFYYDISDLPDGKYVIQVNITTMQMNKIVIKNVMIEQNANNTRTSYVSSSTHVSSDTKVNDPFNRTLFAEWTPNTYTVTFDPNCKGGLISSQTSNGTYSGNNMTITYTASTHEYKLVNSSSSDPYATIGQTVYLTANTTYLMHAEVCDSSGSVIPSGSGSIQIFYAIGGAYNESNSRRFYANTTYQTFTVPTTGTYNIRIDNDCGQTVKVRKFWIYSNFTYQKTVTYGEAYGTLPTPTRIGYTFAGWYTASSGGTQVTESTKVTNSSNHTLYAQWTKVPNVTGSATLTCYSSSFNSGYSGTVKCGGYDVQFSYQSVRGVGTYCAVHCQALGDTDDIMLSGKKDYNTSFSNVTVSGSQCTYTVSWNASTEVVTITISF